jgi:hypothetical protein
MVASAASAQVVQRPPRSATPDGRTTQEFTFQGSLLGGYDDNQVPPGGGDFFATYPSAYTAFGDSSLIYRLGNQLQWFEARGDGFVNTYRSYGIGASFGGGEQVGGQVALGRRNQLRASQYLRYSPYFSLGLLGAVQPDSVTDNTTNTLNESGSWSRGGSLTLTRQWTRNMETDFSYAYGGQVYVEERGFDSRTHLGTIGLNRTLGRRTHLRASYQHSDNNYTQPLGGVVPNVTRTGDVGVTYERRLSPSRQMTLSGGGGASYVDTVDTLTFSTAKFWVPAGYGAVRLDVARSWNLGGDYRRSTSVLQGNRAEPFASHTTQVSLGGDVRPWLESVFTVGYSNGVSNLQTGGRFSGRYNGYTGTAQLRVRMTAGWSSVVSLTHYQYRLNEVASQLLGVSRELHRNSLRAGMSWSLPGYRAN